MPTLTARATLAWFGLFILAFANGAFREAVLKKVAGIKEPLAHQLSCFTGAVFWTAFVWLTWNKINISSTTEAGMVGLYWFVLTVLTETWLINRLISKMTWKQILHTYNVAEGELWGLVLIWIGILPIVISWVKNP
jgi:hypothetical protein